jgi:hypothetical protein
MASNQAFDRLLKGKSAARFSPISICIRTHQAPRHGRLTDPTYDNMVYDAGAMELNDDIIRHRTTPSLLFAPMIAPDDRAAWMRRCIS